MGTTTLDAVPDKPRLRGVLHQWAIGCAVGAGVVLVALSPTPRAAFGSAVFAVSLVTLFTVSATYHRINWAPGPRLWMRRADHASIFVLIAGTYTPVALLGLPAEVGERLLVLIWSAAALGVAVSLFWPKRPKAVTAALALTAGWLMVPYFGDVRRAVGLPVFCLILGGGVAYSLGALAYAAKRPNLKPGVFGYHEFFHAMTLVGASLHYAVVVCVLRATPG
ncbi:MAG: hemolysin III family protein [Myxococcaceae bacterium]|nr:hemolysin III family protein [Myxococcaceae bacterium]